MRRVVVLVFGVCVGLMGACGGDEGGDGNTGMTTQDLRPADVLDAQAEFFQIMCTCQNGGGDRLPLDHPCVVEYTGNAQARACKEQALQARWTELRDAGECQHQAYVDATACLLSEPYCSFGTCLYRVNAYTSECPQAFVDATSSC